MDEQPTFARSLTFGPFRLFPSRQLLLKDGRPIQIGTRALAILELLAERAGDVVSKEELIAHVWPDTFVQEGNVKVHIAAVRRVLDEGRFTNQFIVTIPGRGYRFVGTVSVSSTRVVTTVDDHSSATAAICRHA
jgi:DNA-binding winged helix-turn-helix (wHTH) protein